MFNLAFAETTTSLLIIFYFKMSSEGAKLALQTIDPD